MLIYLYIKLNNFSRICGAAKLAAKIYVALQAGKLVPFMSKRDPSQSTMRNLAQSVNMAASAAKLEPKLILEIRTKSVEQTLVPLVTQV